MTAQEFTIWVFSICLSWATIMCAIGATIFVYNMVKGELRK